jgi:hypothetical protein
MFLLFRFHQSVSSQTNESPIDINKQKKLNKMQKTDTSSINNSRFETPVSSKINLSNQYSSEDDVIEDNHVVHAVVSFLDDYFERPKNFRTWTHIHKLYIKSIGKNKKLNINEVKFRKIQRRVVYVHIF